MNNIDFAVYTYRYSSVNTYKDSFRQHFFVEKETLLPSWSYTESFSFVTLKFRYHWQFRKKKFVEIYFCVNALFACLYN
jgi:hypothetical protein